MQSAGRGFGYRIAQSIRAYVERYPGQDWRVPMIDQINMRLLPKLAGAEMSDCEYTLEELKRLSEQDLGDPDFAEALQKAMTDSETSQIFSWPGYTYEGSAQLTLNSIWLFESYREFSLAAAGAEAAVPIKIRTGGRTRLRQGRGNAPPVIMAPVGAIGRPYPMLQGRYRQSLPAIPGKTLGRLSVCVSGGSSLSENEMEAWLIPCRTGSENTMVVAVTPGTYLVMDVRDWPIPHDPRTSPGGDNPRVKNLRRALCVLDNAPGAFAAAPSISAAYDKLEKVWNDQRLEEGDPTGDLLKRHARRLRSVLEDLAARPRAVLRTEHRMLKLQAVRRTDAKTLRWLSSQPGRNIAERAGARQRVKAPKRQETIATLENAVLRAFAALTVREANTWLSVHSARVYDKSVVAAHQLRARKIEAHLKKRNVLEARPPVMPNFPLRFDPRYREIWRAWQELRNLSSKAEIEWMWQHRTFLELLSLRTSMKLHDAVRNRTDGGILSHGPVLGTQSSANQGRCLIDEAIGGSFGVSCGYSPRSIEFRSGNKVDVLGAVAEVGSGARIWWNAPGHADEMDCSVGELPWTQDHPWDERLQDWAEEVISIIG